MSKEAINEGDIVEMIGNLSKDLKSMAKPRLGLVENVNGSYILVKPEGKTYSVDFLGNEVKFYRKGVGTTPPIAADVEKAAEQYADVSHFMNCGSSRYNGFIAGANYERAKLPEIIKEVLRRAADEVKNECTLYDNGGDNIDEEVREHILSTNCDDLIK